MCAANVHRGEIRPWCVRPAIYRAALCVCVCVCARARVCARACACVHAYLRACVCVTVMYRYHRIEATATIAQRTVDHRPKCKFKGAVLGKVDILSLQCSVIITTTIIMVNSHNNNKNHGQGANINGQ